MSCADPETFIWRVGCYGPSSEMPFKWHFAGGPILADICRGVYVLSSILRLYTVIVIEISLNEHLLKCHAQIQKRLSGERAIIGPPAVLLAGQYKLISGEVCRSKVPLYDCIQSLQLKFLLMSFCWNVMRRSRNICRESSLLLALQRNAIEMVFC